ncbi:MAG: HEAT repeat domain-containing protein, partial [Candidatus Krumholzibacteriota bacterium]|nr:HEAT repeat domain-containing protein [Candidatus Krumholzibacteriota bacterium]
MKRFLSLPFCPVLAVLAGLIFTPPGAEGSSRYVSLLRDPQQRVKLETLARMEREGRLDPEIKKLLLDPEKLIRIRCAEVLGRADDPIGTVFYLSQLCRDKEPEVVESALYSLGLCGWRKDTSEEVLEIFQGCLRDSPLRIKTRAIEALGKTRLPAAGPLIIPYLKNFHASLRSEAALALAALGDSTKAEYCFNSIHDPDPGVISSTVYALGKLGYKKKSDRLIPLLDHENSTVVLRSAEALGRLEAKNAVKE